MWIEYFKKVSHDGLMQDFPERKVLSISNIIMEVNWPLIFKVFGDATITHVNIYLDWAEPQSVAYLIQQYCRYRQVPCKIIFGVKADFNNLNFEEI